MGQAGSDEPRSTAVITDAGAARQLLIQLVGLATLPFAQIIIDEVIAYPSESILIVATWLVMQPEAGMTVGMLVAFQMFASRMSQPLLRLVGLWQEFQQASVSVKRLGDILDMPQEPFTLTPQRAAGGEGRIDIKGVSFRYSEQLWLSCFVHTPALNWRPPQKPRDGAAMNSIQWRVFDDESANASREELDLILTQRSLSAHFQPILRTRDLSVFGWEALIRGPATSTLARPDALFAAARHCGRLSELDYACRETSIASFAAQREATGHAGKLFLNIEPMAFVEGARQGWTRDLLVTHGLLPANVVIEITEASPHLSYDDLCEATEHYRSQGFEIAIDDLGEAYASLRVWSEVRPNYVKIDRHFIHAAVTEPSVRRLLEMIVSLSYDVGSVTIAEGVETETQWQLMHQLGFDCVQGFLFATPAPLLSPALPESVRQSLLRQVVRETRWFGSTRTVATMAKPVAPVTLATDNQTVYRRFLADAGLTAIPVVDDGRRPIGLIARQRFLEDFSRPYRHELFGRRSCGHYVAKGRIVAAQTTIHELTRYFQTVDLTELGCPFLIVDEGGRYFGMGDGQALLRTLVEVQLEAARYANPLTGLPGSVPINDRIDQYLARTLSFVVAYVDISHFKAYNDVYGFVEGDEMIRLVAELLRRHTTHPDDFVGHIGGDDFIVLWADPDWEKRVAALFASFTSALPAFYQPEDWQRGGITAEDRQGNRVFHPVSALTVGAVRVLPGVYDSHRRVALAATEAKKMAKNLSQRQAAQGMIPANALFIERRRPKKGN